MSLSDLQLRKSSELYERAKRTTAAGVNTGARLPSRELVGAMPPLYFTRGKGSTIWDVDGNEYIDCVCGFGPVILGHCDAKVTEAVKEQLDKGTMFGENSESEIELAEMVTECVPCAESVRILNTGSDATAAAIRLARTRTGKDKILKFSGDYHGWHDWSQVDFSVASLGHAAGGERRVRTITTEGVPEAAVENTIVIPWNNLEEAERTVKRYGREIAAIITEPYLCNYGVIPPKKDYLKGLRELTHENDIVLIFDEVITGFRFGLGGAQEKVGVTPDVATFAKAMGNGFPIAMIAGNKETMEPAANLRTWLAGTYSANNLSTAAAVATIHQLRQNNGQTIYGRIYDAGDRMINGVRETAKDLGIHVLVSGVGPAFSIFFTDIEEITEPYQVYKYLDRNMASKFVLGMIKRGVFIFPAANLRTYIGAAHTRDAADRFVQACRESMKEAKESNRRVS